MRLVQILPGAPDTDIVCRLIDYTIRHDQVFGLFEALSYVWGDSSISHRIYITPTAAVQELLGFLDVTENLFAALLRLRDRALPRTMWVDAICINQDDLDERASQVGFMAKIYSHALRVIVWLGEEHDDDRDIFSALEDAAQHAQSNHIRPDDTVDEPSLKGALRAQSSYTKDASDTAVSALLHRPWFSRIWVLQEVAAARCVVLVCGAIEISGSVFARGLRLLSASMSSSGTLLLSQRIAQLIDWDAPPSQDPTSNANTDLQKHTNSLRISVIGELLERFRDQKATDRRDMVFALLGMSIDGAAELLAPSYTKDWADVFADLIRHILKPCSLTIASDNSHLAVITVTGSALGVLKRSQSGRFWTLSSDNFRVAGPSPSPFNWVFWWPDTQYCRAIRDGDILFMASGAASPSIIRSSGHYFDVIVIAIQEPLTPRAYPSGPKGPIEGTGIGHLDWHEYLELAQGQSLVTMLWDWSVQERGSDIGPSSYTQLLRLLDNHVARASRLYNHALLVDSITQTCSQNRLSLTCELLKTRDNSEEATALDLLQTAWSHGSTYEWLRNTIEDLRWCSWLLQNRPGEPSYLTILKAYWKECGYACQNWTAIRSFLATDIPPADSQKKQDAVLYSSIGEPRNDAFYTALFPSHLHPSPAADGGVIWPQAAVFQHLVQVTLAQSLSIKKSLSVSGSNLICRPLLHCYELNLVPRSSELQLQSDLYAFALVLEAHDGVLSLTREDLRWLHMTPGTLKLMRGLLPLLFRDYRSAYSILATIVAHPHEYPTARKASSDEETDLLVPDTNFQHASPRDQYSGRTRPFLPSPPANNPPSRTVSSASTLMSAQAQTEHRTNWYRTHRNASLFFREFVDIIRTFIEHTELYEYASAVEDDCLLPFLHFEFKLHANGSLAPSRETLLRSLLVVEKQEIERREWLRSSEMAYPQRDRD